MASVTIVVPCYNVEKYLRACFDSLLKQTCKDFVVMAVNDGSPDNCWDIIVEYMKKYPDVIIGINKENGGYGSVLELAIKECRTPYFLVCDPDDTLTPDAVETLLDMAKISGADLTIGAKTFVYNGVSNRDYDSAYNKEFTTLQTNHVYKRSKDEFNDLFFVDPSPHAKLYRKEVASSIRFPHKVSYTDNLLFYLSLLNSRKVIYTDKALANYLIDRPGNTMTDVRFKAMKGQIDVFKAIVEQASTISDVPDMYWYRMFESFKFMLYQTRRLNCTEEEYSEVMDNLKTYLDLLVPHGKQIRPIYNKFSKAAPVEKLRDLAMLTPMTCTVAYGNLRSKMQKEFKQKTIA